MTLRLAIALLALAACRTPCPIGSTIAHVGEPSPGWELVVERAQALAPCQPRPLSGTIRWRPAPWDLGDGHLVAGMSDRGACNLDLDVARLGADARSTALAHEIGHWYWHWCLRYDGEPAGRLDFAAFIQRANAP